MGDNYVWGVNPIKDYLFQVMTYGADISDPKMKENLETTIITILDAMGVDTIMVSEYLDFKIKKEKGDFVRVVPANIVTALWFSGILPSDCDTVYIHNKCRFDGKIYTFNRKTKRLKSEKIKE